MPATARKREARIFVCWPVRTHDVVLNGPAGQPLIMTPIPSESLMYWDADDDVEDIHRYTSGGFHPIRLGDVLSSTKTKYRVFKFAQTRTRFLFNCMADRGSPTDVSLSITHLLYYKYYILQTALCCSQDLCGTC
jgi:hypothetical protein